MLNPDLVPLANIMTHAPITARATTSLDTIAKLMTEHHVSCIPIVDETNRPTGIITKLDLVECRADGRETAREVMMPHAMTLGPDATVSAAAGLMSREGFHHLLVVDGNSNLVGVVSTFDITRWVARLV